MRYAVGEIVLVMIGILLALQVNNWNENRKERILEIGMLNELVVGLTSDINILNFNIEKHNQATKSCEIVLNALSGSEKFADSLAYHFAAVNYYTRFESSKGAYESLKSKGFEIISNDSLRFEIINLYDQQYKIIQENSKIEIELILELRTNFNQNYFDKFVIFNERYPHYGGEMIPNDFNQLKLNNVNKQSSNTTKIFLNISTLN